MLLVALTLSLFGALGFAGPLFQQRDVSNTPSLEELRDKYPGIFWDEVFTNCNETQRDIIIESTRVAVNDLFPTFSNNRDRIESSGFNRFFIRPRERGIDLDWSRSVAFPEFSLIDRTFSNLVLHITQGGRDSAGRLKRAKQVKYTCREVNNAKRCGTGTAAQTHIPALDEGEGWATTFCPVFLDVYEYMLDVGNVPNRIVYDLPLLHVREHVILHELAHADVASGRNTYNHITDIKESLPGYTPNLTMYGATLSHKFAWLKSTDNPSSVNPAVGYNADNFAWVYTNEWFAQRYGWNDDGRTLSSQQSADELIPADDEFVDSDWSSRADEIENTVFPPAGNCLQLSDDPVDLYCTFMRGTEDDWLAEKDQPFVSYGGCDLS
ncbi:hypothetical protein H2198_008088 [Neophaeococcomyces mojaviensis]|uniref:Uncharacterized protein n=1 Tax=Neophaeococcomyces mojaviensis TaxID=3383035 RepID=A0ACC2ZY48_9EURO|nr:hypothetical protein H2198_008088 [Knufia sp. JES_112]